MKSVLITGASGFIGSHLTELFLKQNYNVSLFIRKRNNLINEFERLGAKVFEGNFESKESLESAVHGIDIVIHNAATTKTFYEKEYLKVNAQYTKNLLHILTKDQKLIFISSQSAAGPSNISEPLTEEDNPHPISYYGKSKLIAEQYIREWGIQNNNNFIILRPCAVFGPRDKGFLSYFKAISKRIQPVLTGGIQRVSLIYVKDLALAVLKAAEVPRQGETYFVSNDELYDAGRLGNEIKKVLNIRFAFKLPIHINILSFISRNTEKIYKGTLFLNFQKLLELSQIAWLISNDKIKNDLHWKSEYSLEQAVKETVEWYLSQ